MSGVHTLESRMARSAFWMVGLRLADRSIGLVSVLFLARLLVPADFGLVAMGTVILGALEAVTAFGFEMALIKRQAKDRERWDTAWTLNAMIGALHAALIILLIPVATLVYGEPRVTNVMLVLAGSALLSGLRNIGMVEYEQDLRFGPIVVLALVRRTASFLVTLLLAWWYGTYWALLLGMLTGYAVDVALSYRFSAYRPRFCLTAWRDLFAFSKWLLVTNFLGYASNRGGDLIVGSRAGAAALGTYTVSFELANLPTSEMVWPVMRAVFPGYALMSNDLARLAQGFLKVFSLVLLFALPAAAGIALLAEPIVAVLLGPKWKDAGPMIQVLAIYGGIRAAQANTGSVYMALDRPQLASAIALLNIVLGFGSFAIALGSMPVADAGWFLVGGGLVAAVVNLAILRRKLGLSWRQLLSALVRPMIGSAAMAAGLATIRPLVWTDTLALPLSAATLVGLIAVGAALYVACVLLIWRSRGGAADTAEQAVVSTLAHVFRRYRPKRAA